MRKSAQLGSKAWIEKETKRKLFASFFLTIELWKEIHLFEFLLERPITMKLNKDNVLVPALMTNDDIKLWLDRGENPWKESCKLLVSFKLCLFLYLFVFIVKHYILTCFKF